MTKSTPAEIWVNLPETLREKLLADTDAHLSADEITTLVHAGVPVTLTYWVSIGPGPDDDFRIGGDFRRYVESLAEAT